jgi:galactokinase
MNESLRSCLDLFDCSCPELDELTALARASGAYGSRLTGAGWGGCTVSLVSESKVEDFKNKLRAGYSRYRDLTEEKLNEVVFSTKPSSGAFGMCWDSVKLTGTDHELAVLKL